MTQKPLRLGLTGGIGSGKSTVAGFLADAGAAILDADAISRSLTQVGGRAIPVILATFGETMITPEGALNRDAMRNLVFSNPDSKRQLESILHPLVSLVLQEQAQMAVELGKTCLVFDVPLLVEGIARWRPQLDKICDLADQYDALVMVDECHATGFIGKTGRGTVELKNVLGRVDIITGTLGKALGGAMGGFTSGRKEIIEMLRQKSRPYLFSNSLAPAIVGASIEVLNLLGETTELRDQLEWNVNYFKDGMKAAGFDYKDGESAIVPIMLYDAALSQNFADRLLAEGIYVIGFFYPVVPQGQARIRVQLSAAHTQAHLDKAIAAFTKVGNELGVLS